MWLIQDSVCQNSINEHCSCVFCVMFRPLRQPATVFYHFLRGTDDGWLRSLLWEQKSFSHSPTRRYTDTRSQNEDSVVSEFLVIMKGHLCIRVQSSDKSRKDNRLRNRIWRRRIKPMWGPSFIQIFRSKWSGKWRQRCVRVFGCSLSLTLVLSCRVARWRGVWSWQHSRGQDTASKHEQPLSAEGRDGGNGRAETQWKWIYWHLWASQ